MEDLNTALAKAPGADQRDRCGVAGDPARVQLSLQTDAERASLELAPVKGGEVDVTRFRELETEGRSKALRFQHGLYVLRLQASWPQGDATFIFTLCV